MPKLDQAKARQLLTDYHEDFAIFSVFLAKVSVSADAQKAMDLAVVSNLIAALNAIARDQKNAHIIAGGRGIEQPVADSLEALFSSTLEVSESKPGAELYLLNRLKKAEQLYDNQNKVSFTRLQACIKELADLLQEDGILDSDVAQQYGATVLATPKKKSRPQLAPQSSTSGASAQPTVNNNPTLRDKVWAALNNFQQRWKNRKNKPLAASGAPASVAANTTSTPSTTLPAAGGASGRPTVDPLLAVSGQAMNGPGSMAMKDPSPTSKSGSTNASTSASEPEPEPELDPDANAEDKGDQESPESSVDPETPIPTTPKPPVITLDMFRAKHELALEHSGIFSTIKKWFSKMRQFLADVVNGPIKDMNDVYLYAGSNPGSSTAHIVSMMTTKMPFAEFKAGYEKARKDQTFSNPFETTMREGLKTGTIFNMDQVRDHAIKRGAGCLTGEIIKAYNKPKSP